MNFYRVAKDLLGRQPLPPALKTVKPNNFRRCGRPRELLPVGLAARGDGGKRVEVMEESLGLRLRKKLLNSPHLRDSTSVDFPDPEWPNSLSLILGWRFCVGRSCWMKSPLCVSWKRGKVKVLADCTPWFLAFWYWACTSFSSQEYISLLAPQKWFQAQENTQHAVTVLKNGHQGF